MRDLFLSERRYMQNIIWKWAKIQMNLNCQVVLEHYSPPRASSRIRFNNDYFLQFVSDEELTESKAFLAPILPNTVGADVFVTVDKLTLRPLRTELLAGEAFPIRYFNTFIKEIDNFASQLSLPISMKHCAYLRIFIVGNDICFLAFPDETLPVVRGRREMLCATDDSTVAVVVDGDSLVCLDGWIKTSVEERIKKLVAIPT